MKKFDPFILDIDSPDYPKLLKESYRPPKRIFVRGDCEKFKDTFRACLSVVGSRKMTSYGKRATKRFIRALAGQGITIISGFMYGIDAEAHRAALDVGGKTAAVMPCGIERICPVYQKELYYEILNSGGYIISEYEGDKSPRKWTFPQRNRIVAGLSQALLVIEAGGKSGTLITAKYARKGNRKIFAVPGSIFSANSKGIYQLINSGASIAPIPSKVVELYEEHPAIISSIQPALLGEKNFRDLDLDALEKEIITAIKMNPLSADDLIRRLRHPTHTLIAKLTSLCLRGLIVEEGEKYYVS